MQANWVKQAVSSGGTGNLTLGSAATGYIDINTVVGQGPYFRYLIEDGNDKEIGLGYLSASTTLVRATVLETLVSGTYDDTSPTALNVTTAATVKIAPDAGSVFAAAASTALDYDNNGYIMDANAMSSAILGSLANRQFLMPFLLTCRARVTGMACEITTGAAGSIMLGIYQSISRSSAKKLAQLSAAIDSSTTGVKTGNLASSIVLTPGHWCVVMHTSAAPSVRSNYAAIGHGAAVIGATSYIGARYASSAYSNTLPDTLAASSFASVAGSFPRIALIAP